MQQYKPGPGRATCWACTAPRWASTSDWNLGLSFNYARNPLNFLDPRTDDFVYAIVKNQFTFDLMGSIALFDRFELGVALPITYPGLGVHRVRHAALLQRACRPRAWETCAWCPRRTCSRWTTGCDLGVVGAAAAAHLGRPGTSWAAQGVAAFPRVLGEWGNGNGHRACWPTWASTSSPEEQFYNLNVGNELPTGWARRCPSGARAPARRRGHPGGRHGAE